MHENGFEQQANDFMNLSEEAAVYEVKLREQQIATLDREIVAIRLGQALLKCHSKNEEKDKIIKTLQGE